MKCNFSLCQAETVAKGLCAGHYEKLFNRVIVDDRNLVAAYRARRGWTQAEMARRCRVSEPTLGEWEGALALPGYVELIIYGLMYIEAVKAGEIV